MKRIRIIHHTDYFYKEPVSFGPHRALIRPREGHDLHIESSKLAFEPEGEVRWMRDIYGNTIALLHFQGPSQKLSVHSELEVHLYEDPPVDWLMDPSAQSYPFQYSPEEQVEIITYRLPSYPHDGPAVQKWLGEVYMPGQLVGTAELLEKINKKIFEDFAYNRREEAGVQLPCRTLALGSGSCRDFAVFMMEATRHLGFASRFVTGYIQMEAGQHGATHAWTEIYLPGAGWRGYDPTNNKLAGSEHIVVGVSRDHEKASPLSGTWEGPANAFDRLDVKVMVEQI